jgi:hypothetical protein
VAHAVIANAVARTALRERHAKPVRDMKPPDENCP